MKKNDYGERYMKKFGLSGAVCACVLPFVISNNAQAVTVYSYTGNNFTGSNPISSCTIGNSGCFTHITATFELSTALTANQTINPDTWSISDGVTTITDQTADVSPSAPIQVGTDVFGTINAWRFIVERLDTVNQPLGELVYMQTINLGGTVTDATAYCLTPNGTLCSNTPTIDVEVSGTWTVTTVPVPAAVWLFGSGLLGLLGVTRRRRST
jgi:hypothetical protein